MLDDDRPSRDELISMVDIALKRVVTKELYRGGASGLLSDLIFACGYPMTPQRIRKIVSAHRQTPQVRQFELFLFSTNRKKGYLNQKKPL